jgi:pyruvate dehydrogenase E1 component
MDIQKNRQSKENTDLENREWIESFDWVYKTKGTERAKDLLRLIMARAAEYGVQFKYPVNTPYVNTIPAEKQPRFPGIREIERRIKSIIRWNAMAMVLHANKVESGIGGHISTYASAATLYEIGFNHFFHGKDDGREGDIIYFQGHASPGIYARAFLEGRLTEKDLRNFRREIVEAGLRPVSETGHKPETGHRPVSTGERKGLSSYPHPWLMPDFWEFPTVSMGLSPIMGIYQARFIRYLEDRGMKEKSDRKVWVFLGDGEMDEPEALGAITLASREQLDNLIFVINCNLQRLDGPVRGNGKIIQELEAAFRGANWNVIKVIWGNSWDPLLAKDVDGVLVNRMNECLDGQYQKYTVSSGDYIRKDFFGKDPRLLEMVENYTDEQLQKMVRGGHDPEKVYAAYQAAVAHKGRPTVILAKTIKGYGLGEAGEGRNITHQQKKLNEDELRQFRDRFGIPISDEELMEAPFYKPPEESKEIKYLRERRKIMGGFVPKRNPPSPLSERRDRGGFKMPSDSLFKEFYEGTGERDVATTMVMVHLLSKLLKDKDIGKYVVPIVPDEARTFGMESLFRQVGIYSHLGQLYEPVDKESLLYYNETKTGAMLEEGITEAGSMSSFIAAGTSYATLGIPMLPFFFFYSMFGFQRIGDLIWAAADMRTRGFLIGGTAGRTTLAGEGLQHQDGNSQVLALTVPNLRAYDPAFAYEIAVIVKDGIRRMYEKGEDMFYYMTVMNEFYVQPPMPAGVEEGILKGMYKYKASAKESDLKAHLFGSGSILNEAIKAQQLLEEKYGVSADVWSVTSYKQLYRDATDTARWNMLHPEEPKKAYITQLLESEEGVFVAASDYIKALPNSIAKWIPNEYIVLGTDGFGRSDGRKQLRDFFEVDARYITAAALHAISKTCKLKAEVVKRAIEELGINPEKSNPVYS